LHIKRLRSPPVEDDPRESPWRPAAFERNLPAPDPPREDPERTTVPGTSTRRSEEPHEDPPEAPARGLMRAKAPAPYPEASCGPREPHKAHQQGAALPSPRVMPESPARRTGALFPWEDPPEWPVRTNVRLRITWAAEPPEYPARVRALPKNEEAMEEPRECPESREWISAARTSARP